MESTLAAQRLGPLATPGAWPVEVVLAMDAKFCAAVRRAYPVAQPGVGNSKLEIDQHLQQRKAEKHCFVVGNGRNAGNIPTIFQGSNALMEDLNPPSTSENADEFRIARRLPMSPENPRPAWLSGRRTRAPIAGWLSDGSGDRRRLRRCERRMSVSPSGTCARDEHHHHNVRAKIM
jgi:hypothetical protein